MAHRIKLLACVGVCAVAGLGVASCGGRGARAPEGADSPQEQQLLGGTADFAIAVRIDRLRNDPVYMQLIDEDAKNDGDVAKVLANVTSIDAVGTFDGGTWAQPSLVLAVRGARGLMDMPDGWRKDLDDGGAGHTLPTGVFEYVTVAKDGWPWGVYLTPKDWVVLSGKAAGHGRDWFTSSTTPPPPVDFGEDVLLGMWIGPNAMHRMSMKDCANEPGTLGLDHATFVLRDGAHGDLIYSGTYDTSAHAQDAARAASDSVGMYASVWKRLVDQCPALGGLGLETNLEGRTIEMRVTNVPSTIHAAMKCQGMKM